MAMTHYIVEIDHLLDNMFAIKSLVLPANRRFVERYLDSVWSLITELTTGFRRAEWNDAMREKFQSYVVEEENKMRERLETIRYDIDAADTLVLVTGPGRIEKVLLYTETLAMAHCCCFIERLCPLLSSPQKGSRDYASGTDNRPSQG